MPIEDLCWSKLLEIETKMLNCSQRKKKITYISLHYIVHVIHDVSCKAKITDLHHIVVGQQDVSGSKVTVNALKTFVIQPQSYSFSHTLM